VSDTFPPGPAQPQQPSQGPPPAAPEQPYQQPAGAPEYLEAGGGSPLSPETGQQAGGGGRRRGLLIGAGIAALALVGVGAWAAAQFFATGAQPAEALPAGTIGYVSIDLDPSGAQKIEALRTLNKFPAFKEELGLNADDDIREKLFDALDLPDSCQVFYKEDVEPWLGERMALAAVVSGGKPQPVAVLQVHDADAADAALRKFRECGDDGNAGWVIDGDWAVVAETEAEARAVVDSAKQGTLADDEDFQKLTAATGSAGIATLYAAPEAGKYLADSMGTVGGLAGDAEQFLGDSGLADGNLLPDESLGSGGDSSFADAMKSFKGAAVSVRFDNGALEVEAAGDPGLNLSALSSSDRGGDVMETLPGDTAAAIGVGFESGWLTQLVDQISSHSGGDMSTEELFREASADTGLDLPGDAETLLGRSAALAISSDLDPEAFFNSTDPDLPIALKVQGDPDAIKTVLGKIASQDSSAADLLASDSDGDTIAIGPDADYRKAVLARGSLGTNDVYRDVVRESDKASVVLFVNFDAGDWLVRVAGDDKSVAENLRPLAGFGITTWKDDDYTHGVLRLTTD
jgi:hypothetical protein